MGFSGRWWKRQANSARAFVWKRIYKQAGGAHGSGCRNHKGTFDLEDLGPITGDFAKPTRLKLMTRPGYIFLVPLLVPEKLKLSPERGIPNGRDGYTSGGVSPS